MKIALVCGGTGGHLYPGLATAKVLRRRGHEVTLWLAGRGVESHLVEDWDGPTIRIPSSGLTRRLAVSNVAALCRLVSATLRSRRELKRSKLDVMLAMGSYASVGPVVAARMAGIPIVLHEANVVPGRAISFLARGAERIGITFPSAARHFPEGKTVLTGLPLFHTPRPGMPRKETGTGPFSILVMGGSQGAQHLNTVMPAVFSKLQEKDYRIKVIHLAGDRDNQTVDAQYREAGVSAEVMAFASNMPDLYLGADIAICRSGAATCMELAVFGLPAVLVPYPHASRDHQLHNARALEAVGAARIFEQPDLTVDAVREYIANCMDHPEVLAAMREALSGLAVPGADEKLANLVEQPDMTSNV